MTPENKTGRGARPTDDKSVRRREQLDAWQRQSTDEIVRNIVRLRDHRKLSNEQLRGRLASLGWDLTRDSLASILAGSAKRKAMPVTDICLFAQALNVAPVALVFPITTNAKVPRSPGAEPVRAIRAANWFAGTDGDVPPAVGLQDVSTLDDYYAVSDVINLVREHDTNLWRVVSSNQSLIDATTYDADPEAARRSLVGVIEELEELRKTIRRAYPDVELEPLPAGFEFIDAPVFRIPALPIAAKQPPPPQRYKGEGSLFDLYREPNGKWRYNQVANSGVILATSEPFDTKTEAILNMSDLANLGPDNHVTPA